MILKVNTSLSLELVAPRHAQELYELASANRMHLREWLPWLDHMQSVVFIENFIKGTVQRNSDGSEYAFVIMQNDQMVGRAGIYKLDKQNKIAEIGYWIAEDQQGTGIVTAACRTLISFCFDILQLNRIEVKCGTGNHRSQAIPRHLGFRQEGILRQAELVHGTFIDLELYSLLKNE